MKVLAGLDISEQRAPQDGGFTYRVAVDGSDPVDIRAATLPTNHGERATLRLLGTQARELTLTTLGMWRDDSQVADCHTTKRYAAPGERTGARIRIEAAP